MKSPLCRTLALLLLAFGVGATARAQSGGSAVAPTLKVSTADGSVQANGVTELRFPAGAVQISGRTATVNPGSGSVSSTATQPANLLFASPSGAAGPGQWRRLVNADVDAAAAIAWSKVSKTMADIVATLGYTPLNPANNLSDLGSAPTARSNLGLGTAATLNVPATGDAASGEVVKGNDTRLTNSRTPTAHASTHAAAGSDPVTLAQSQVTNLSTDLAGKQPLDATLTALAAYNSSGIVTQTAADTFAARTITGTTNQVNVSNGNGVAGNPTLSLPQSIATTSTPTFGGMTVNASQPVFNFEVTGTTGKGRLTSLVGNWFGMTANLSFNGTNWIADDTSLPGWVFKLDARNNTAFDRFEVGRIAAGGTPAGGYTSHLAITGAGSVVLTSGSVSTSATDGFVYIPTVAGTPTGTPTSQTGRAPIVFDTTNFKLCVYAGGAWRCATF